MIKVRCPICQRPLEGERQDWPLLPFCSARCKTIDLGRWLGEEYRVPAEATDDGTESADERKLP